MYSVSDRFLAAIRKSHTVVTEADVYQGGDLVTQGIPVISGSVTDDSQAIIRRRVSLALAADASVLDALTSVVPSGGGLWPLGNEIHVRSGIRFQDDTTELVPVGVFRISRPFIQENADGVTVSIDGFDRSRAVSRARFTEPYVVSAGTNYAEAIQALIQSRLATLDATNDFIFMTTEHTTPQLVFTSQDDPMQMAINMAGSIGAELFFDGNGRCVLRPEPNPAYDPSVFDYVEGEDATVTEIGRDLDDEQAYNGVIVVGENSELPEPVRAEAWDTNQNSPTYYDPDYPSASLYGPVPFFISSQYVTTTQQAQDAANANLARVLGIIEKAQFGAITNPAHQSGDIITVQRQRIGMEGVNILDSITFGLGENMAMSGSTRKRRV